MNTLLYSQKGIIGFTEKREPITPFTISGLTEFALEFIIDADVVSV